MARTSNTAFLSLPSGRVLYRLADEIRYVVVSRGSDKGFWIVENGWATGSFAAGPFHPHDVLRAFMLANTIVPEGCELGPWQSGIGLFERSSLPGHAHDWSIVDPAWLEPSICLYSEAAMVTVVNESCCTPAQDRPRIDWTAVADSARAEIQRLVNARFPAMNVNEVGLLKRPWDVHVAGSPVVARTMELRGEFGVVDQPPAPSTDVSKRRQRA